MISHKKSNIKNQIEGKIHFRMVQATPEIIGYIVALSFGMMILSQIFTKKFGLNATAQADMQLKMQEYQERMAQAQNSPEMMQEMQVEMMAMMQTMMKKQLLPQCVRTLFFLGFWGLLGVLFGQYEIFTFNVLIFGKGAVALYFLISLGTSLVFALGRKLYQKMRPQAKKEEPVADTLRALQRNIMMSQSGVAATGARPYTPYQPNLMRQTPEINLPPATGKDWKKKLIENNDAKKDSTIPADSVLK